jgi:hypothetical protein
MVPKAGTYDGQLLRAEFRLFLQALARLSYRENWYPHLRGATV